MRLTWDPAKRVSNLAKHGLDFSDAGHIFRHPLLRQVSVRNGERRVVCVGLLEDICIVIVMVVRGPGLHIVSMRKAKRRERKEYQKRHG